MTRVFSTDDEKYHLIFEREPKTGLTIWAIFDTNERVFVATGHAERWDDAAAHVRDLMMEAKIEVK